MENLPAYIPIVFGLTAVATLVLCFWVMRTSNSKTTRKNALKITIGLMVWMSIQAAVSWNHVYTDTDFLPPKIVLFGILPVIFTIVLLFITSRGRRFIDSLPLINLTYLNIVRVPVELVLFWLFLNKFVPGLMTFEGRNLDILAGITAPIFAYLSYSNGKLNRKAMLIWNFTALGLLLNIVVNAFLSTPSPLQQFAFDQPNIAILYFPFSWLPTFIVPIVLLGHLASIRQLTKRKKDNH